MTLPNCGRLIACDALLGAPRVPFPNPPHIVSEIIPDVADLEAEMARLRIDAAVVRHRACLEAAPYVGNDLLTPLILPYPKVRADDLHVALEAFPRLPIILINVLRQGRNRLLEPLLTLHPNLHLCFHANTNNAMR